MGKEGQLVDGLIKQKKKNDQKKKPEKDKGTSKKGGEVRNAGGVVVKTEG